MRVMAVAILILLAGCGGAAEKTEAPDTTTAKVAAKPSTATPSGKPTPAALSRFRCAKDAKGRWNASGYLANASKVQVTFQVTVYVGEAAGGAEKARTKQVPRVAPGGSVKFAIGRVPAPKEGGPCYVQVLASK